MLNIFVWPTKLRVFEFKTKNLKQICFLIFFFCFSFTYKWHTNVVLVSIFEDALKKILTSKNDSMQYDTARNVSPRSMILQEMWLRTVWYCKECDSAQYDTARNVTPRSMILCEAWLCAVSYRVEIWKIRISRWKRHQKETISTHWSVAQAGSNDEKNGESKILLDCPLR